MGGTLVSSGACTLEPCKLSKRTRGLTAMVSSHSNFRLADLVTLLNGFCGAMSLYASANYLITSDLGYLWQALWLPLGGLFFDFLDGRVARWRNESSMLGQELDSLADSVSFGVAPSVLAFAIGLRTPLDTVVLAGFVCCGIARLARFNATVAHAPKDASGKSKYFEGLPIPSTLVLVGAMAECVRRGWIEGPGGSGQGLPFGLVEQLLPYKVAVHWETGIFGIWAAMMVSKTLRGTSTLFTRRLSLIPTSEQCPSRKGPHPQPHTNHVSAMSSVVPCVIWLLIVVQPGKPTMILDLSSRNAAAPVLPNLCRTAPWRTLDGIVSRERSFVWVSDWIARAIYKVCRPSRPGQCQGRPPLRPRRLPSMSPPRMSRPSLYYASVESSWTRAPVVVVVPGVKGPISSRVAVRSARVRDETRARTKLALFAGLCPKSESQRVRPHLQDPFGTSPVRR